MGLVGCEDSDLGPTRKPAAQPCRRATTAPRSPKAAAPKRAGWVWLQVVQGVPAPAAGDGVLPPCLRDDAMGKKGVPRQWIWLKSDFIQDFSLPTIIFLVMWWS